MVERNYYLPPQLRWLAVGIVMYAGSPPFFKQFSRAEPNYLILGIVAVFTLMFVVVINRFFSMPHVVLKEQSIRGVKMTEGTRRLGRKKNYLGMGELEYDDIGTAREGKFLLVGYKRYYSRKNPSISIIVLRLISNAQECFASLDARIKKHD